MSSDDFNTFFFTSNLTNYVCPNFGDFACPPPSACARDATNGKEYCCDQEDVCWIPAIACASDKSTTTCGTGQNTWCCSAQKESCTGTPGQINICWSNTHDILTNISAKSLNDTYSSLSSAYPTASTYHFDPLSLIAKTAPPTSASTTHSSTSTSSAATHTSSAATSSASAARSGSSNSLSGGAIGGIVVGSIVGLALLAVLAMFIRRKRRTPPARRHEQDPFIDEGSVHAHYAKSSPDSQPMSELHGSPEAAREELPANEQPAELPGNSREQAPGSTGYKPYKSPL